MLWFFGGIVLALALRTLWEEWSAGERSVLGFVELRDESMCGDVIDFPLPEGWEPTDVLITLAEIEAL